MYITAKVMHFEYISFSTLHEKTTTSWQPIFSSWSLVRDKIFLFVAIYKVILTDWPLFVHSKRLTINSPVTRSGCIERGIFTTLCKQVRDQIMYNLKSNKPYVIQPKMDEKIGCQDVVVFSCNVENEMYSKCITLAVMYM
jgi:hypothetical protein